MPGAWWASTIVRSRLSACSHRSEGVKPRSSGRKRPGMAKVFDSSAILAFLYEEPGWEKILPDLPGGLISAVNAAEVLAVLVLHELPLEEALLALRKTRLRIVDFSVACAAKTAELLQIGRASSRE